MGKYYRINMQKNAMQHGGIRGMKWGYNDGKKNGKRTAREERYIKGVFKSAITAGNADINRKLGEENENYKQYYENDKKYDRSMSIAREYGKRARDASGVGYKVGYAAGKISRGIDNTADKISRGIDNTADKVKQKVEVPVKKAKKVHKEAQRKFGLALFDYRENKKPYYSRKVKDLKKTSEKQINKAKSWLMSRFK